MRKTQLLKFLAGYLIGAAGLICVPAYSQNTVEIVGERTVCTGDCTGVVWNGVFMQVSMPGSGVSNTTYAAGNNDGTTGTEPKFNRTAPGCQREFTTNGNRGGLTFGCTERKFIICIM